MDQDVLLSHVTWDLLIRCTIDNVASANLDSEAAFTDRARKIGLTEDTLAGLLTNHFNTFGRLAFAVSATPTAWA